MSTATTPATTEHDDHEDEDVHCECGSILIGLPGELYCPETQCPNGRYS